MFASCYNTILFKMNVDFALLTSSPRKTRFFEKYSANYNTYIANHFLESEENKSSITFDSFYILNLLYRVTERVVFFYTVNM